MKAAPTRGTGVQPLIGSLNLGVRAFVRYLRQRTCNPPRGSPPIRHAGSGIGVGAASPTLLILLKLWSRMGKWFADLIVSIVEAGDRGRHRGYRSSNCSR